MNSPLTPNPNDTPKQRKHREQAIVIGTLVLVILTFMLVMRRGQDSAASGSSFTPSDAGGSGGQDLGALPLMVGSIPGQVAAEEQGNFARLQRQLALANKRLAAMTKRQRQHDKKEQRQITRLQHEIHDLRHPRHPGHHIPSSHHVPVQGHGRKGGGWLPPGSLNPLHPPQHHSGRIHEQPKKPRGAHAPSGGPKFNTKPIVIPFGNMHTG